MLAPTAVASSQAIEVDGRLDALKVEGPSRVAVHDALLRASVDPMKVADGPLVRLEGGVVHVRQYWHNATSIVEPTTGNVLYRWSDPWASQDLAIQPDAIHLVNPVDRPDVRLHVHSVFGVTFDEAMDPVIENGRPADVLGPSRAYTAVNADLLSVFERPPAEAGWAAFRPTHVQGFGDVDYLFDGWGLRLSRGPDSVDVHTGTRVEYVHRFGEGGEVRESYSFLHIMALGARHTFDPNMGGLEGFVAGPQIAWDGPAELRVRGGRLGVADASLPLTATTLRLAGRFETTTEFDSESAFQGAVFHAAGTGTTDVALPASLTSAVPLPQQAGFWTSFIVGALAVVALGIQAYRQPKRGPASAPPAMAGPASPPPPPTLEELVERAQKSPLDGEAQFDLGVALMRQGEANIGIRALDRSFRLQPGGIVKLLEDPSLAPVREHDEVRVLLGRFQREQYRKVWAGYA